MTSSARVRSVEIVDLDVPLLAPFGISGGSQDVARNLHVSVTLEDGTIGYGEAAPLPAFNGETQASVRAALAPGCAAVRGLVASKWRRNAELVAEATKWSGAARCALETALLDAVTKRANVSLLDFFGGAEDGLVSDITLPLASIEEAAAGAQRARDAGFLTLKIKVGGGDLDRDVARVLAAHDAAPDAALLLDGNGGLDVAGAIELVRAARAGGARISLFEQPTPGDAPELLGEVAVKAAVPVAADESATSALAVPRLARAGASVVNIKLMKSGVAEALEIALAARAHGLGLMIGGMIETRLAMGTSACFAAGLGRFGYVDLDTPLFLASDPFEGGYVQLGPILDLSPIVRGHGAAPRDLGAGP